MTAKISRYETREATYSTGLRKDRLCVGDFRKFLAEVDSVGISDDTLVFIDTHVGEGAIFSGHIKASQRIELD